MPSCPCRSHYTWTDDDLLPPWRRIVWLGHKLATWAGSRRVDQDDDGVSVDDDRGVLAAKARGVITAAEVGKGGI